MGEGGRKSDTGVPENSKSVTTEVVWKWGQSFFYDGLGRKRKTNQTKPDAVISIVSPVLFSSLALVSKPQLGNLPPG